MGEFRRPVSSSGPGNLLLRISFSGFITLGLLAATLLAVTPPDASSIPTCVGIAQS